MRVANLKYMKVHITPRSSNTKVGKVLITTTEESSCPKTCPFINQGCYAKSGPLSWHWKKVSNGTQSNVYDWDSFTNYIRTKTKPNQFWRMNQAGDIPSVQGLMRLDLLKSLVDANKASGAKGYTYTHNVLNTHNVEAIKYATKNGFTINASTESFKDADSAINKGLNAVTVIPSDHKALVPFCSLEDHKVYYRQTEKITTPNNHKVVVCPAQKCVPTKCENCKLCSVDRGANYVIAFVAHGNGKKAVNKTLNNI